MVFASVRSHDNNGLVVGSLPIGKRAHALGIFTSRKRTAKPMPPIRDRGSARHLVPLLTQADIPT
jgi:hypothetical protein